MMNLPVIMMNLSKKQEKNVLQYKTKPTKNETSPEKLRL